MEEKIIKHVASIVVPIFFGVIFVLGVTGNGLVIVTLSRIKRATSRGLNTTNRFILNLAIADLLFLVFCVPFQATIYTAPSWLFGSFMCVFCRVCLTTFMLASIYTMVVLSLDRYFAIVHATSARQCRSRTNASLCIVAIWCFSVALGGVSSLTFRQYSEDELSEIMEQYPDQMTPQTTTYSLEMMYADYQAELELYGNSISASQNDSMEVFYCIPNIETESFQKVYKIIIVVIGYILPLLFIFVCYLGVIRVMRRKVKSGAVSTNRRSQDAKKRATKIVICVVVFFAIHWFPYHFAEFWFTFADFQTNDANFALIILAHCLSYANCCVNPIIYAFMSLRFRNNLKMILKFKFFSKKLKNFKRCLKCGNPAERSAGESGSVSSNNPKEKRIRDNKGEDFSLDPLTKEGFLNGKVAVHEQEQSCTTCLLTLTPVTSHLNIKYSDGGSCSSIEQSPLSAKGQFFCETNLATRGKEKMEESCCSKLDNKQTDAIVTQSLGEKTIGEKEMETPLRSKASVFYPTEEPMLGKLKKDKTFKDALLEKSLLFVEEGDSCML